LEQLSHFKLFRNTKQILAMDQIKKKMLSMKTDKENAMDKAEQMEQKLRDTEDGKAKMEEDFNNLQKKFSNLENEFDTANESLQEAQTKLEASEKQCAELEAEAAGLNRRIQLLEEDLESVYRVPRRNWKRLQRQQTKVKEVAKYWKAEA